MKVAAAFNCEDGCCSNRFAALAEEGDGKGNENNGEVRMIGVINAHGHADMGPTASPHEGVTPPPYTWGRRPCG